MKDDSPLSVPCRTCGAEVGEKCRKPVRWTKHAWAHTPQEEFHTSRIADAEAP